MSRVFHFGNLGAALVFKPPPIGSALNPFQTETAAAPLPAASGATSDGTSAADAAALAQLQQSQDALNQQLAAQQQAQAAQAAAIAAQAAATAAAVPTPESTDYTPWVIAGGAVVAGGVLLYFLTR